MGTEHACCTRRGSHWGSSFPSYLSEKFKMGSRGAISNNHVPGTTNWTPTSQQPSPPLSVCHSSLLPHAHTCTPILPRRSNRQGDREGVGYRISGSKGMNPPALIEINSTQPNHSVPPPRALTTKPPILCMCALTVTHLWCSRGTGRASGQGRGTGRYDGLVLVVAHSSPLAFIHLVTWPFQAMPCHAMLLLCSFSVHRHRRFSRVSTTEAEFAHTPAGMIQAMTIGKAIRPCQSVTTC